MSQLQLSKIRSIVGDSPYVKEVSLNLHSTVLMVMDKLEAESIAGRVWVNGWRKTTVRRGHFHDAWFVCIPYNR